MGNKGSKSKHKLSVANASVYDIYVKLVPEPSNPPVKAQLKRSFYEKQADNSSQAYIEELTVETPEKENSVLIRPCEKFKFSCLEAFNFLSVEADDGIGRRRVTNEMKIDTNCNQIFAYTMMKGSKKGKVWVDKEGNDYETHFDNIRKYLKTPDIYRKRLNTQLNKLYKDLEDAQLKKMVDDITKKKREIEQLENKVKLDNKALSSDADFEVLKEKRRKQFNISLLPTQN